MEQKPPDVLLSPEEVGAVITAFLRHPSRVDNGATEDEMTTVLNWARNLKGELALDMSLLHLLYTGSLNLNVRSTDNEVVMSLAAEKFETGVEPSDYLNYYALIDDVKPRTLLPPHTEKCASCGTEMAFDDHNFTESNPLEIEFSGGYGWFVDPITAAEAAELRIRICHECAHLICKTFPFFERVINPHNSHSHTTQFQDDHPYHDGWDYDMRDEREPGWSDR